MIDPRPYTYEYRKPRPNNPTLYFLPNIVNHPAFTTVFTTWDSPPKIRCCSLGPKKWFRREKFKYL